VVNETTLQASIPQRIGRIKTSTDQWYSTDEGEKRFKGLYKAFNEFKNFKMTRDIFERICFTLDYEGETCKITFPYNFPQAYPTLNTRITGDVLLEKCIYGKEILDCIRAKLKHL
jgi:hypothetical protein